MSKRLSILEASLAKKNAEFDQRLSDHMGDVRSANGQPLNDKRCGAATMKRWDKQSGALRTLNQSIEKTKEAIEREQNKIANVDATEIPDALRAMVAAGELVQWRKHPETFFVPGVDRGRIVWVQSEKILGVRYASEIPKDQYPKFRDTFYKAKASVKGGAA